MNHVGPAADGTIFDVLLLVALSDVEGDDDFFAAGAADIGSFVLHGEIASLRNAPTGEPSVRNSCPAYMTISPETKCESQIAAEATLAKALAPEEIRVGDFVTPLYVIAEVPSYWWRCDSWSLPPEEPVRIRITTLSDGTPYKVRSVCVPFVFVKAPCGEHKSFDLRTYQLARLNPSHAKQAWKAMKKSAKSKAAPAAAQSSC